MRAVLLVCLLAGAVALPQAAEAAETRLIVFNRLGPAYQPGMAAANEALVAHRETYLRLAREGVIEFGGRMDGEPPLGMSVIRPGVERAWLEAVLGADPAVQQDYIDLEIREMTIQLRSAD